MWVTQSEPDSWTALPRTMQSHIPFSPTKKCTAPYMCQEGKPLADIAAELDVSTSSISHNLWNLGHSQNFCASTHHPGHPHVLTSDELQKIRRGIELGDYPDASAAHHALVPHVDVTTVCHALCDMVVTAVLCLFWLLNMLTGTWIGPWSGSAGGRPSGGLLCTQMSAVLRWKVTMGLSIARGLRVQHFSLSMQSWRLHMVVVGSWYWPGFITCNGVGHLHRVDGRVNARAYTSILHKCLLPTISNAGLDLNAVIFQQDGARSHTARWSLNWLASHNINTMPWPIHLTWTSLSTSGPPWSITSECGTLGQRIWMHYGRWCNGNGITFQMEKLLIYTTEYWNNVLSNHSRGGLHVYGFACLLLCSVTPPKWSNFEHLFCDWKLESTQQKVTITAWRKM